MTRAKDESSDPPTMILSTQEVRSQLKIIAALTRSTMKDVLARLVAEELQRVARPVRRPGPVAVAGAGKGEGDPAMRPRTGVA
jgi:hypothetical protein